jgi:Winged helix DNA-binding domain
VRDWPTSAPRSSAPSGPGPLTRAELAERLAAGGVDPAGQRIAHLVQRAGLEGLVCHGPDRGHDPTFVLVEDWVGQPRPLGHEAADLGRFLDTTVSVAQA